MIPHRAYVLPIAGTHGWRGDLQGRWWADGSLLFQHLGMAGLTHLAAGRRPFIWTTDLNGHRAWRSKLGLSDPHLDWRAAGENLFTYLRPFRDDGDTYVPIVDRNLVAHSHGLQVVLYACAGGLKVNRLLSVGSPVREDMMAVARLARPNITSWWHVHSDRSDRWQWLGAIGDGATNFLPVREHPLADHQVAIKGVGHTGILESPAHFAYWHDKGLIDYFAG